VGVEILVSWSAIDVPWEEGGPGTDIRESGGYTCEDSAPVDLA
jgi:hypothetical protein